MVATILTIFLISYSKNASLFSAFFSLGLMFWLDSTLNIDRDLYAPSASVPQIADSVELLDLSNLLTGRITEIARFLGSGFGC